MSDPNQTTTQRRMRGIQYPAGKRDLLAQAQSLGVGDGVLSFIRAMPNREYQTAKELRQAIANTAAHSL